MNMDEEDFSSTPTTVSGSAIALLAETDESFKTEPASQPDKHKIRRLKHKVREPLIPVKQTKKLTGIYFTDHKKVNLDKLVDFEKRPCPFRPPPARAERAHIVLDKEARNLFQKDEGKKSVKDKRTRSDKYNNDKYERLYVKDPPLELRTVTDYDKTYNTIAAGRPASDVFGVRQYISTVRDVLRTKIITAYREDDIMKINRNLENEQKILNKIRKYLKFYSDIFDRCLAKDHQSASNQLEKVMQLKRDLEKKGNAYKKIQKAYKTLKASLYNAEIRWKDLKKYQKFLIYVSPLHWKNTHPNSYKDMNKLLNLTTAEEEHMFDDEDEETVTFDIMVENLRRDCEESCKPQLYFKEPEEIIKLFKYMETQNISYMIHAEELAVPLEKVHLGLEEAARAFDLRIELMENNVIELTKAIEWEEARVEYLEKMATTLIHTEFKKLIMAPDVLNLYVFVEDIYEAVISHNDANLSISNMMAAIEQKYMKENLVLDGIPQQLVQELEVFCFGETVKSLRLGQVAEREHAQMTLLLKQLRRAYEPPYVKGHGKEPKQRSKLIVPRKYVPPPPPEVTDDEMEYLEFFTDFCQYTDDPSDYKRKKSVQEKEDLSSI